MHRLAGSLILSCLALGADAAALRRAGQPAEPAPEAAPAAAAGLSHVLVVSAAEGVAEEKLVGVLVEAGASREEASAVVQRVAAEGESAVAQGPEEAMARLKAAFSAIGVEAQVKTVEELQKQLMADASEFAGSDVTELSLDDAKASASLLPTAPLLHCLTPRRCLSPHRCLSSPPRHCPPPPRPRTGVAQRRGGRARRLLRERVPRCAVQIRARIQL